MKNLQNKMESEGTIMSMFLFRAQWIVLVVKRGIVEDVLGGWDGLLSALILFMVVEYLTQILVAILNKNLLTKVKGSVK